MVAGAPCGAAGNFFGSWCRRNRQWGDCGSDQAHRPIRTNAYNLPRYADNHPLTCSAWMLPVMSSPALTSPVRIKRYSSSTGSDLGSPMGRMVAEEDVARTVLFLASDQSIGMTGQSINVDVGAVMN